VSIIARRPDQNAYIERFNRSEYTSTSALEPAMASMIASLQSAPGRTSRGAIQQRRPFASSVAQRASAVGLSFDE